MQQRWSALPTPATLLAETLRTREGWHLFLYPFAGRHAHMGLASLLAWRAAQGETGTFSIAVNDYGLELLSATERDWAAMLPELLRAEPAQAVAVPGRVSASQAVATRNTANADGHWDQAADDAHLAGEEAHQARHALLHEVLASLNATEMARRRFREIARVSGLIFQSHPGERRSARQLQASSQLFFEVFRKYDDSNLLLRQADEEVLSQELDVAQLLAALRRMQAQTLVVSALRRPSPFAFPLMVERFREKLTNEHLADRIARMLAQLHEAADAGGAASEPRTQDLVPPDPPLRPRKTQGRPAPAVDEDTAAVRRTLDSRCRPPMAPRPMPPAAARAAYASPRGPCRCCRTIAPLMKGHAPLPSPVSPTPWPAAWACSWPASPCTCWPSMRCGGPPRARCSSPTCTWARPPPSARTAFPCRRAPRRATWSGCRPFFWPAVRRLVVLGDFLHAAEARNPAVLAALARWRSRHAAVELVLVRGNHDSHAGDPPPALGFAIVDEPWHLGPFAACHHPRRQPRTCRRSRPGPGMCWPAMSIPPSCCAAPAATPCACRALPCTRALPCCPPSACSPAWPACRPSQAASSCRGRGPGLGRAWVSPGM